MGRPSFRWLGAAVIGVAVAAGCRRSPPPPPPPHPAGGTLAVAFWNLEWFPGRHPHARAEAQAAHVAAVTPIVARLDADVLGLEEVADRAAAGVAVGGLPGFKVDVCSEFLRGPEAKPRRRSRAKNAAPSPTPADDEAAEASFPPDDGAPWTVPDRQQIALCSRLPVLATGAEPWKPDAAGQRQRRGFVWAAYRVAPGEVALVYGLHLKSNVLDEPGGQPTNILRREEASRQVLAHVQAAAAAWARTDHLRLVVLGGDMNTSLDDGAFAEERTLRAWMESGGFRWGWEGIPLPRRLTLPAKGRYPAACFDHVFYRTDDPRVALTSAALGDSRFDASDHRLLVARFSW